MTKYFNWIICSIFLLGACARQSAPTGGPKDTIPPQLVRVNPAHETVNFNAKKIELEFSEHIILNNPKDQLIVTPNISKDYKLTYRRNLATLELAEPLDSNTTYTFNFRDAIADITEKNPVRNLFLAYSTGTYIDSLQITGNVHNILAGTIPKEATVALHPKNDTFNIFQHPAPYFTKTDTKGNFKISHLKPGEYFLYTFEDKNRNLVVNSRTESFGFLAEEIKLTKNVDSIRLGLQRIDAGPLRLVSARPYNTYFNIRTSKALQSYTVSAPDSTQLTSTYGEDQANIRIYDTFSADSLLIHFKGIDSLQNAIDTTLYAKFLDRKVTPENFSFSVTNTSVLAHRGILRATLQFTKPIAHIALDSIYYLVDSTQTIKFQLSDFTWHPDTRKLELQSSFNSNIFPAPERLAGPRSAPVQDQNQPAAPKPINELRFAKAAFLSIEGDTSAHNTQTIKPLYEKDLAIININIETNEPDFIVQLLNNRNEIIQFVRNQHRVRFTDVQPGDYKIRLIIDRNQNGRWDPGNYEKRIEPEPIVYYLAPDGSQNIKGVKANWEIGTEGEMLITW